MTHAHYMVDPAFLPAAGVKRMPAKESESLARRREMLTSWHVLEQQKTLKRLGMQISAGGHTPREVPVPCRAAAWKERAGATSSQASRSATPRELLLTEGPGGRGYRPEVADGRLRGVAPQLQPNRLGLDVLIQRLRQKLQGVSSLAELERLYNHVDEDGDGSISTAEFKNGLRRLAVPFTEAECDGIFSYFDEDHSGSIDFKEFMRVVKGRLSTVRRAVVLEAFQYLDANGDGVLDVDDLRTVFQAFEHRCEASSGARAEDEVMAEVLESFDLIDQDRRVTLAEFEKYYEGCSALIVEDGHFDALVRNTWRLKDATGNTCMRIHITRGEEAGRTGESWRRDRNPRNRGMPGAHMTQQETVEIRPPLAMSQHDARFPQAIGRRLEEMGYHNVVRWEQVNAAS